MATDGWPPSVRPALAQSGQCHQYRHMSNNAGSVPVGPASLALPDADAATLAAVFQALADPLRVRVVSLLASTPERRATVGEIAALTHLSQPTVSHHLRVLRDAGILRSEPQGTARWQELTPGLADILSALFTALLTAAPAQAPQGRDTRAHGLEDAHRSLEALARELAAAHPELEPELVHRVVFESYAALARASRVGVHLVVLTERFARQRLEDIAASRVTRERKPQILFVCVQNAGRSQLAAALARKHAGDAVVVRSAGSLPAAEIHENVRTVLAEIGGVEDAFPKPLTDDAVRAADVVITMGCGDVCPYYPGKRYEDWSVGDPALASLDGVRAIRDHLDDRVRALLAEILPGQTS